MKTNKALTLISFGAFGALALAAAPVSSGLSTGEYVSPFHPTHVSGPDKGTDTCPPCKYGKLPAVQAWFNPHADAAEVMAIAKVVEEEVEKKPSNLKGFMIMLSNCAACEGKAKNLAIDAEKKGLDKVAFAYINSKDESIANYKINTDDKVKNTIMVYKNRQVVAKFVNLKNSPAELARLRSALASAAK